VSEISDPINPESGDAFYPRFAVLPPKCLSLMPLGFNSSFAPLRGKLCSPAGMLLDAFPPRSLIKADSFLSA